MPKLNTGLPEIMSHTIAAEALEERGRDYRQFWDNIPAASKGPGLSRLKLPGFMLVECTGARTCQEVGRQQQRRATDDRTTARLY